MFLAILVSTHFMVKGENTPSPTAVIYHKITPLPFTNNLQMWLDGMDPLGTGVTPTASGDLPVWNDKSGKGNHATAGTKGRGKQDYEFGPTEQMGTVCMLDTNMYYGQIRNYCQIPSSVITSPTYDISDHSVNFVNDKGIHATKGQYYTTPYTALPEIEHVIAVVELNQASGEMPLLFGTNYYGRALYFKKINYGADFFYDFMAGQFAWGGGSEGGPWSGGQINADAITNNQRGATLKKYSSNLVEFSWSKDSMQASISAKSYQPNFYGIPFGCGNGNIWYAEERSRCIVSACATEENKECNVGGRVCWCGQRTLIGASPGPCAKNCFIAFTNLKIKEIIIYGQILPESKLKLVRKYLIDKWVHLYNKLLRLYYQQFLFFNI